MGADACFDADGAPKNEALNGDTKVLQSSPESTRPQSRRLTVFNDVFILLIYILYIVSIIFYFFTLVCSYMTDHKEPAHRSARAIRESTARLEGQPTVAPTTTSEPTVAPTWSP